MDNFSCGHYHNCKHYVYEHLLMFTIYMMECVTITHRHMYCDMHTNTQSKKYTQNTHTDVHQHKHKNRHILKYTLTQTHRQTNTNKNT